MRLQKKLTRSVWFGWKRSVVRPATTVLHYERHKEQSRRLVSVLLTDWSTALVLPVKRVAIRNQRRSWGSCSSLGNLNFNYKLLFVPPCFAEYVVVHELCHLRELNHGAAFWAHVAGALPDYEERRQGLRTLERDCRASTAKMELWRSRHTTECLACGRLLSGILRDAT